tara:strand:+ start:174 stop:419 length:246 start_codon:yes stop_codon:yes gene_type:complete
MRGTGCFMRREIVLAGVMIWLSAGGTASSERAVIACVPVPSYQQDFLDRSAGEIERVNEGSTVAQMLGDYALRWPQADACR